MHFRSNCFDHLYHVLACDQFTICSITFHVIHFLAPHHVTTMWDLLIGQKSTLPCHYRSRPAAMYQQGAFSFSLMALQLHNLGKHRTLDLSMWKNLEHQFCDYCVISSHNAYQVSSFGLSSGSSHFSTSTSWFMCAWSKFDFLSLSKIGGTLTHEFVCP